MRQITLDDFLDNAINEEKFEKAYTQEMLDIKYDTYKAPIRVSKNLEFQIYMTKHAKDRFRERFIDGNILVSTRYNQDDITFNALPGWKSLKYSDLDKVLVDGINQAITGYKFKPGAYMIISEGTRLIVPMLIARIENNENKRAVVVNTFLHTGMSEIDRFHLGKKEYEHEELRVENRKISEFYDLLKEEHSNAFAIIEDEGLYDEELGIYLEYIVEGSYLVSTNVPLLVVD